MKRGPLVAFIVLVGAAVLTFVSFSGATARHVTIAEAMRLNGQVVQVPGRILHDTVRYDLQGDRGELRFDVADMQGGSETMTIVYSGAKPENFANATSVEAIGAYSGGVFRARTLLVKCPSRYQGSDQKQASTQASKVDSDGNVSR
ncbi:MAG: cytochrome c maturation protein CcmE [Chthonomonadales bacterium]|nr:cytochrome c maturation protein CcmE [Chthonomonadales bacterium]